MKPTFTCMVVRELAKALGSSYRTDHLGQGDHLWKDQRDIDRIRTEYLMHNITRKMAVPGSVIDTASVALNSFIEVERANRQRNNDIDDGKGLDNDLVLRIIRARGIIEAIIGSKPTHTVMKDCHFTGGASTSRTRSESFVQLKYVPTWDALTCTQEAFPFWRLYVDHHWLAYKTAQECDTIRGVRIQPHARWSSVPKDAKTDRSIVIGNDCNVFLQRGAGIFIRKQLFRFGIDLQDQSRNRRLAQHASIYDDLVTHDAVDSSNRILRQAVRMLLPYKWYQFLDAIREKSCTMPDGSVHSLEMFSSMGNGFTFELQSLIYFALSVASQSDDIRTAVSLGTGVFGDDVVIPSDAYSTFLRLITFFGMEANTEKTASCGLFRESCGGHYHFGTDISPFFIREPLETSHRACIKFVNELRTWYYGSPELHGDNPKIEAILSKVVAKVPYAMRNQVPLEYGNDCGFYSSVDGRPVKFFINRDGHEVLTFSYVTRRRTSIDLRSDDDLPWYLLVLWSGSSLDGERQLFTDHEDYVRRVKVSTAVRHRQPEWVPKGT